MVWFWPFGRKKEGDDLAAFEKELGISPPPTGIEEEKPIEESYDKLGPDYKTPGHEEFEHPALEARREPLQQASQSADMQLVIAKLDTIRVMLDTINQRLTTLEKHVEEKQKQRLW
jgi:hypothetical protein